MHTPEEQSMILRVCRAHPAHDCGDCPLRVDKSCLGVEDDEPRAVELARKWCEAHPEEE